MIVEIFSFVFTCTCIYSKAPITSITGPRKDYFCYIIYVIQEPQIGILAYLRAKVISYSNDTRRRMTAENEISDTKSKLPVPVSVKHAI